MPCFFHQFLLNKVLSTTDILKTRNSYTDFQKSCMTCNCSCKLPHIYFSCILTTIFSTTFQISIFFLDDFSVDVFISIYTLSIKTLQQMSFLLSFKPLVTKPLRKSLRSITCQLYHAFPPKVEVAIGKKDQCRPQP